VRLRWHIRQVLHTRDESISVTGYGDDEVVLVGPLAKRSSERRYLTRQIVLIDGDVRPHAVQELIFADRPVSMFEQDDEHVERFGRDRYQATFPPQPSLDGIDNERTERIPSVPGRFSVSGVAHLTPLPSVARERDTSEESRWAFGRSQSSSSGPSPFCNATQVPQRVETVPRAGVLPQTFRSLKGSDLDRPPVGVSHRATATFQFFSTLFRTFGIDTPTRRG
jgi:hypothetical protein